MENGGSELEVRVEALEGTAADHETRISVAEVDINGKEFLLFKYFPTLFTIDKIELIRILKILNNESNLNLDIEEVTSDQETRLAAAEENIQGERCYREKKHA